MNFTSRIVTDNLETILNGINKAADIVISTMGGAGKNVIIANNQNEIVFTKDGVSVAKKIRFENKEENIGAQLLINAAKKTVEEHGDGTTLTSLFVKEFANLVFSEIKENPESDINALIDLIKKDIDKVKEELRTKAQQIETNHDIYRIAFTSCKSPRLASFIAEIYSKTGLKANISLENSRVTNASYYELINGITFESGFIHSRFANQDNGNCYFENPFLLLSKENILSASDYEEVFDVNYKNNTPMVIIAPNFSDSFIRFCLTNKRDNGLEICLIKTPGYGAASQENMKDIAAFINGDGTCSSISITPVSFTIYNEPDKSRLKKRIEQLEAKAEGAVEEYDEKTYLQRIANLNQSTAIIYVGGITEKNAKEEYDRLEDAIGAVKSAIREGYVRGAGVELYNIALHNELNEDGYSFSNVVKSAIISPFNTILSNARANKDNIKTDKPFNLRSKQYDDTLIDPVGVLCSALDNSFALIELLINTSYLVYNE